MKEHDAKLETWAAQGSSERLFGLSWYFSVSRKTAIVPIQRLFNASSIVHLLLSVVTVCLRTQHMQFSLSPFSHFAYMNSLKWKANGRTYTVSWKSTHT